MDNIEWVNFIAHPLIIGFIVTLGVMIWRRSDKSEEKKEKVE